jgi:hypothetical protein
MGRRRRTGERDSFAEIAARARAESTSSPGQPIQYVSPIADREYTDEHGVRWRMRGGEPRWTRIEHLMSDSEVRVLHVYLSDVNDVTGDERGGLLARIRPYLKGERTHEPDDQTDFDAAEFKDDQHHSLLVIEESC